MRKLPGLDAAQRSWVAERMPDVELIRDMSWGLVETTVLQVRAGGEDVVVKATGSSDTHLPREISAHGGYTTPLVATGHAGRLRDASTEKRVILLEFLPGELVLGTDTVRPGRRAAARLHEQESRTNAGYEPRATAKALHWLGQPHRIVYGRLYTSTRSLRRWRTTTPTQKGSLCPEPSPSSAPPHCPMQPSMHMPRPLRLTPG